MVTDMVTVAVLLTMIAGLAVFVWLGQSPLKAFRVFFVDPVSVEVACGLFPVTATSAVQGLIVGEVEGTVS